MQVRPDPLFAQVFLQHTKKGVYETRTPDATAMQEVRDSVKGLPLTSGFVARGEEAAMASTPAYFWLSTERNDCIPPLLTGRASERAQLAATAQGLSMHPLSQALQEYPEQAAH